jgi:hypothetical protein
MRISLANEVAREGDWFFFFRRADLDKLYPSEPKRRRSKPKRRKPSRAQALIGQLADEVAQLRPQSCPRKPSRRYRSQSVAKNPRSIL